VELCRNFPPLPFTPHNTSPQYPLFLPTLHTQRRALHQGRFYDNSKGKVERHRIGNRIALMNDLKFDWLNLENDLTNNAIKIELKKQLNFDFFA